VYRSARAAIEYMIVKTAGDDVASALGLSDYKQDALVRRFDRICSTELPRVMREAEISLVADLARHSNTTEGAVVRACSPRARLERFRVLVRRQHVLRDQREVSKKSFAVKCPELLELLRAAVRANTNVSYKARGDTPIDALIVEKEQLRGAGGQKERFARFLNMSLARRGLCVLSVSAALIPNLAKAAGIISASVLRIKDSRHVGVKYCRKFVQTQKLVRYLFSAHARRVGLDQMKLLKCNTDATANAVGGRSRTLYTLEDERAMTHSKGCGGDHLCKFGLEALLLESVVEGGVKLPAGFDLATYIPSYNAAKFFNPHMALAHMYVHIQEREGESGYRDFADLSEFVSRFPRRFLTPQLLMIPFLFLERDNAHGVSSLETRFMNVLFNVLHGIYYSCLGAQEAGQSRGHQVETVNGAAIRALSGVGFDLPMNVPSNAPDSIKHPAQEAVREQVLRKFPVTYKTGGAEDGFVSAEAPRTCAIACGFVFRTPELRSFVAAAKKGPEAMREYVSELKEMPSFNHPLGYDGVLMLAWRLLHATGAMACTKLSAHSFEYKYNPSNPDCPPPDAEHAEPIACFEAFLLLDTKADQRAEGWVKSDGFVPQPRPSRERVGREYANLDEVLKYGGATTVDEWYPEKRLDALIAKIDAQAAAAALNAGQPPPRKGKLLLEFTSNHNSLKSEQLKAVLNLLWVDETTLYAELAERVSKDEYKGIYESMKVQQTCDGTNEFVFKLVEGLIGKPANARSDWPYITDLKLVIETKLPNVKVPQNPKRAVLIQLIALTWRNLSEAQRPALIATRAATRAPTMFATAVAAPAAAVLPPAAAAAAPVGARPAAPATVLPPAAAAAAPVAAIPAAPAAAVLPPATAAVLPLIAPAIAAPAAVPPPTIQLPPVPAATLAELRAQIEFVEQADARMITKDAYGSTRPWSVAESIVDEEEVVVEEEAQRQAEEAAAESLVEAVLELVTVECRRCYHKITEGETHYDSSVNHSVCNDHASCTLRMPVGGRKRARPEGGYARFAATGR